MRGTTVILTTHYLDEAAQLADRVAIVSSGKVVGLARPDELGGADARTPRVHWIENGVEHTDSTHRRRWWARSLRVSDLRSRGCKWSGQLSKRSTSIWSARSRPILLTAGRTADEH